MDATAIAEDSTEARDLVRAHVSRVAIRPLPAQVDPALEKAIERIREKYNYYEHMNTEAAHADLVPDELVDLFALAGTRAECTQRLKEIESLGVDQVSIVPLCGAVRAARARFAVRRDSGRACVTRVPPASFPAPGSAAPGAPPPLKRALTPADGVPDASSPARSVGASESTVAQPIPGTQASGGGSRLVAAAAMLGLVTGLEIAGALSRRRRRC